MKKISLLLILFLLVILSGCDNDPGYYRAKIGDTYLPFIVLFNGASGDTLWYYDFIDRKVKSDDSSYISFEKGKPDFIDVGAELYDSHPINIFDSFVGLQDQSSDLSSFIFEKVETKNKVTAEQILASYEVSEQSPFDAFKTISNQVEDIENNQNLTTIERDKAIKEIA